MSDKEQALIERIQELRRWLEGLMPDSRELRLAQTKLDECEMWAKRGVPKVS